MAKARPKPAKDWDAYLAGLGHPLQTEIVNVSQLIARADGRIVPGIKWASPSFRIGESCFATINLHRADELRLILHCGAKVQAGATVAWVPDPEGLLTWLGPDRALVRLAGAGSVNRIGKPLMVLIRAWAEKVVMAAGR